MSVILASRSHDSRDKTTLVTQHDANSNIWTDGRLAVVEWSSSLIVFPTSLFIHSSVLLAGSELIPGTTRGIVIIFCVAS